MRAYFAVVALLLVSPAQARPVLLLSHLQSYYAGGSSCVERFWLEWEGADSDITNVKLSIELVSTQDEPLLETLRIEGLGAHPTDNRVEAAIETARCLSGTPRIVVRAAVKNVEGKAVDLIRGKNLRLGKVHHYPITIVTQ
jgi:hypothetical protein